MMTRTQLELGAAQEARWGARRAFLRRDPNGPPIGYLRRTLDAAEAEVVRLAAEVDRERADGRAEPLR